MKSQEKSTATEQLANAAAEHAGRLFPEARYAHTRKAGESFGDWTFLHKEELV